MACMKLYRSVHSDRDQLTIEFHGIGIGLWVGLYPCEWTITRTRARTYCPHHSGPSVATAFSPPTKLTPYTLHSVWPWQRKLKLSMNHQLVKRQCNLHVGFLCYLSRDNLLLVLFMCGNQQCEMHISNTACTIMLIYQYYGKVWHVFVLFY